MRVQTALSVSRQSASSRHGNMRGGSSELLLDPQVELRKRKLLELAHPKKNKAPKRTCRERVWFYATSFFAMTAVSAGSSLLFLVPLYVDPAISTLVADFVTRPVTCVTSRREDLSGIFNCTWSSCREGCTSDMYRCTHIYVTYTEQDDNRSLSAATPATVVDAVLLVNIKGCGYPPDVHCGNFTGEYGVEGVEFPCYYSRENRTVVMTKYDRDSQVEVIINYFAIPFVLTVVTSVVLCVMHCDCRQHPHPPRGFRRSRVEDASGKFHMKQKRGPRACVIRDCVRKGPLSSRL
ncbi:Na+ channel auxiliary subunit TipE [Homalodisca vitripennis]|nr:Na+ channel auxiliary subunit TipE [Homalodisca vitripennis]